MCSWILLVLVCVAITGSLWMRVRRYRQTMIEPEYQISPLSAAIHDLISVAGGLYVSLVMLITFLKLDIPDKIPVLGLYLDPLACVAIGLAIVQPLVIRVFSFH